MVEKAVEYFEMVELPGKRFFKCEPLRATLLTDSCAERWTLAQGQTEGRYLSCKKCPIGATHAGVAANLNLGALKGGLTCSRCHRTNGRLIGKRLCVSCKNREYEHIKQRNAKGTKPLRHPPLHRLTIGYMAGGKVRTLTVERAVDMTELIVDVQRASEHIPTFAWLADPATRALRGNPDLDFSISEDVDEVVLVADVAAVADGVQDAWEQVVAPIKASPPADDAVDPLQALRDAVEQQLERDAPAPNVPSRRAAKKIRQHSRRQVRVSNVTINLLRSIGALPPPSLAVSSVPAPASYSAVLFSV